MSYSLWVYFSGDYFTGRDEIENFVGKHFPEVKREGSGTGFGSNDVSFGGFSEKEKANIVIEKIRKNAKLMKKINNFDIIQNEDLK